MKAAFYLTLLDGLLATAVYQPQNPFIRLQLPFSWSVPLEPESETPMVGSTFTWTPPVSASGPASARDRGMRTTATPVCGYRLALHK